MTERKKKTTYLEKPTSFSDGVNIAVRADQAVLLQMVSTTPDHIIENHRTIMTRDGAIEFLENLCYVLDYFPTKQSIKKND